MTVAQLRALIADDAHAEQFLTRRAYRMSLLIASVESDVIDGPDGAARRERDQQRLILNELQRLRDGGVDEKAVRLASQRGSSGESFPMAGEETRRAAPLRSSKMVR